MPKLSFRNFEGVLESGGVVPHVEGYDPEFLGVHFGERGCILERGGYILEREGVYFGERGYILVREGVLFGERGYVSERGYILERGGVFQREGSLPQTESV